MLLDIQKLISYYMLEVINYSACTGMAGREFYAKGNLTHDLYSSPSLKKSCGRTERILTMVLTSETMDR